MTPVTQAERELCVRIAGGSAPLTQPLCAAARRHRMHLLLAASLSPEERGTPGGKSLLRDLTIAAALDAWHEEIVRELLDDLGSSGMACLVIKGAGLAFTIYPAPHLRPRDDIDVMVARDLRDKTGDVLAVHGWTQPPEPDSDLSDSQRHYEKRGPGGVIHHLDLHWKIANPRLFADALTFEELEPRAIPVTRLGRFARMPGFADALFVACLHRVAHHADAVDLLWLWDIHLLLERLSEDDRECFVTLAERGGMRAVCARSLELVSDLFGTRGAAETAARFRASECQAPAELSAQFLGGISRATILRTDLATLSFFERLRLISDHLFPPVPYMRARYPGWARILLPLAYADRIVRGAPKWFRRGT